MLSVCPAGDSPWLFGKCLRMLPKTHCQLVFGQWFWRFCCLWASGFLWHGMFFLCALRETGHGSSLNSCAVTKEHIASGYSGHGFRDSGVCGRTLSAGIACFLCALRENRHGFSVHACACYRIHTAKGYSGNGFGDSGVCGRRLSDSMACFSCALRENGNSFSLNACAATENTLPVSIRAMLLEILVFAGKRFLLAWHVVCVPCARIAMAFR